MEGEWNLFVSYDIQPLQAHIRTLKIGITSMDLIAYNFTTHASTLVTEFKYMKSEFQENNWQAKLASRAAISFIGKVANSLLAAFNYEYANHMFNIIEIINGNEQR